MNGVVAGMLCREHEYFDMKRTMYSGRYRSLWQHCVLNAMDSTNMNFSGKPSYVPQFHAVGAVVVILHRTVGLARHALIVGLPQQWTVPPVQLPLDIVEPQTQDHNSHNENCNTNTRCNDAVPRETFLLLYGGQNFDAVLASRYARLLRLCRRGCRRAARHLPR